MSSGRARTNAFSPRKLFYSEIWSYLFIFKVEDGGKFLMVLL